MAVERLGRLDIRVSEHPLNDAEVSGIAAKLGQIQGPRCTGYATTVHHVLPSSQYPELFSEPDNLQAACTRCNYGGGARLKAESDRQRLARLQEIIEQQQETIERLTVALAHYKNGPAPEPARNRPMPRIF